MKSIAEHEHAETLPTGEVALNALGMSTQVPMRTVYLTTGSPHVITIGTKQIQLKRRSLRIYAYKSREILCLGIIFDHGGFFLIKNLRKSYKKH